jgi:hypothetical protein
MKRFLPVLLVLTLFSGLCLGLDGVRFETEIRALLQERCVECHGADKQKGELRLDAGPFVFKGGHEGPAVVAGDAAGSPLLQRVLSVDADERMPPKGPPLTPAQVAALREWIESGAAWPENAADRAATVDHRLEHWAVQPVKRQFAADTSVDGLVRQRLREQGLLPAPEADARTLVRRLFLDVWGLPPDPEEVAALAGGGVQAYEALVDRLLDSPHYGERWAQHWLDLAHYADTHGFERDKLRPNAWRYRDYVIDSFNVDKPYDVFLKEQIAGDVMSPPRVVATGFLAAGPWDFVGQVETKSDMLKRAARAGDLDDMVTQVLTASLGLTIHCARCHDHKLDPISQREYYSLCSVFAGVTRDDRVLDEAEERRIKKQRRHMEEKLEGLRSRIARLSGEGFSLASVLPENSGVHPGTGVVSQEKLGYHRDLRRNRLQAVAEVPAIKWVFVPDGRTEVLLDTGRRVQGVPPSSGHAWDLIANRPLNAQRSTVLGGVDFAAEGHRLLAMHANSAVTLDVAELRRLSGLEQMRLSAVLGFGAAESAAETRADFSVYVDSNQVFQKLKMRKSETAILDLEIPVGAQTLSLIATDGGDGIGNDLLFLGDPKLLPLAADAVPDIATAGELRRLREQVAEIEAQLAALPEPARVYAVVPREPPPVVRVQRRGDPEDETEAVSPAALSWLRHAPAELGDASMSEAERRMALAEWITHADNPLTARVMVNRLWQQHFGVGLVATPSDLGLGGEAASHPELLDFLAHQLMLHGWRLKPVHKMILMSQTYRQHSLGVRGEDGVDESNRLLWRQNPRRLDAETVRDAVLKVAGTLNLARGGPGFRDFDYTEAYAPIYDYVTQDRPELWKRSIYRFVVRTTPQPFMSTLDCPDPANMTPVRAQTTTALQALTLSNHGFMLLQAQHFAERIGRESGDQRAAVLRAFSLAVQREPDASELAAALDLVAEQGLFALCRMLLNANEFVYVD